MNRLELTGCRLWATETKSFFAALFTFDSGKRFWFLKDSIFNPCRTLPVRYDFIPYTVEGGQSNDPDYIQLINSKVKRLRFFEGTPGEVQPVEKRVYQNSFSRKDTRTIYWQLDLEHPAPRQSKDFEILAAWYDPKGSEILRTLLNTKIIKTWPTSYHVHGYGWKSAFVSRWEVGSYRVDLYVSGNKIASGTFDIY